MSNHIIKIIPTIPKKPALKVSELNKLFKRLPPLDSDDKQAFEKDIHYIRTNMKYASSQKT